MPLIWRYLLGQAFKVFAISSAAMVALLIALRLHDIARVAALGASTYHLACYIAYQLPYIFPLTCPIAALLACFITCQRLTHGFEITTLRASGFGLCDILAPFLLALSIFSAFNFFMASEVASLSHGAAIKLKGELKEINPLVALNSQHLMKLQGFYFTHRGASKSGLYAKDVWGAFSFGPQGHLAFLTGKKLRALPKELESQKLAIITPLGPTKEASEGQRQPVVVQYATASQLFFPSLGGFVQKAPHLRRGDHLPLTALVGEIGKRYQALETAQQSDRDALSIKRLSASYNRGVGEILRRLCLAISVITFGWLGCAFGIELPRHKSLLWPWVIGLPAFTLICFFIAHQIEHSWKIAAALYVLPHFLLIAIGITRLKGCSRGRRVLCF